MATLQKFKLLATQCAIAGSPSRSPTTSPVFQLRRRRTLKMFLTRSSGNSGSSRRLPRQEEEEEPPNRLQMNVDDSTTEKSNRGLLSNKLKDLFVSSPPYEDKATTEKARDNGEALMDRVRRTASRRVGSGSPRPLSAAFRYRLLKRPWRPLLVTIPE